MSRFLDPSISPFTIDFDMPSSIKRRHPELHIAPRPKLRARIFQEEYMSSTTLTLMTMALYFAVALPADVSMSATLDQVPASTTTPPKGWIEVTHNAGTPQKPVNKPLYINVSQICMVSDSKNEAPRRVLQPYGDEPDELIEFMTSSTDSST